MKRLARRLATVEKPNYARLGPQNRRRPYLGEAQRRLHEAGVSRTMSCPIAK